MKELIKKLRPDSFEDMTALVALFRPGPLQSGMVDDFIARKHGEEAVAYPHPDLEPILKPTYGVILYQEQVMQIAQVLAGYSLGGADMLRRAMGKKKQSEMDKQRAIFEAGAAQRGVDGRTATYIFDLMDKFAGYGFNKSHSAAYALVSYQTLWLKAHYPAAFMAAVLSADMDNTDKVVTLIDECRTMRLEVRPPTVNASEWQFTIADDRTLIYGLGAIKGVGEGAILALQEARQAGGPFRDLWDFCRRIDLQKMNRRVLEALVRSGALDELGANRATLMQHLPLAIRLAEQHKASHSSGQVDLFGLVEETATGPDPQLAGQVWGEWEEEERLQGEKETLGLYLTGHPVNRFEPELNALMGNRLNVLLSTPKGRGDREKRTVAGLVVGVRHGKTPRGRMASLVLDDRTGRLEVTVFSELYDQFRDLLAVDRLLVIAGTLNFDEFRDAWSLRASEVQTLEQAREKAADHLWLTLDLGSAKKYKKGGELLQRLREVLTLYRGGRLAIQLEYHSPQGQGRFLLGDDWRVQPTDELIKRLRQLLGQEAVKVAYGRFIGQSD
jgi:DNA polymerase-3 subunit alpha